MNSTVYTHPIARINNAMGRQGSEQLLATTDIDAGELRRMDDHDLLVALRTTPATEAFAERYDERRLFKRAIWTELQHVPDDLLDLDHDEIRAVEARIADRAAVAAEDVIIEIPDEPSMRESSTRVVVNGEIRNLGAQSPLVNALRTTQRGQWRLGVYTTPSAADRVGRLAAAELGLDIPGGLVTESRQGLHATLDEFE